MENKRIQIINLELGIDTVKPDHISETTTQKIDKEVTIAKKEQVRIQEIVAKRKHENIPIELIEAGFKALINASEQGKEVLRSDLLKMTNTDNILSLSLKLRHLIKSRGGHYKITSRKLNGEVYYSLQIKS